MDERLSRGGAQVTRPRNVASGLNPRRSFRVGTLNVLSLSDDNKLPILSEELRRLKVEIAGLSEVRRPGSGEISSSGYTYYWPGCSNGARLS